ncbi:MAG: DNA recombination protein RmuC [Pseudomonadota bacterium]
MNLEPEVILALSIGAAVGLLLGLLIAGIGPWRRWLQAKTDLALLSSKLKEQDRLDLERDSALEIASQKLSTAFDELASRSLRHNSETFLKLANENLALHHQKAKGDLNQREQAVSQLVDPIRQALNKTEQKLADIEKERHLAYGNIKTQLESMAHSQTDLRQETQNLVKALRRPEVRGQWGEITLRRVAELSGMVKYCDFFEQTHTVKDGLAQRPDMIVSMPDERQIVVDAKTPLDAYLEAVEATTDQERSAALSRHVRNLRDRVKELASKHYWAQFDGSPEFVILFIPGEQFLAAALDQDPTLQDDALQRKVLLATPTSLVGLLKVVAYGWRQVSLAKNAETIRDLGEDLYTRLASFTQHLSRLGKQLSGGVDAYNSAVGSLERQVLPGAKRFKEMGVSSRKELDEPTQVDTPIRNVREQITRDS